MLVSLIRLSRVAAMLGVDKRTCEGWLAAQGYTCARAPLAGNALRNSPRYVSCDVALAMLDGLLPGKLDRLTRLRAHGQLHRQRRALEESTRNVQHEPVGGTGLEAPTPKPPL